MLIELLQGNEASAQKFYNGKFLLNSSVDKNSNHLRKQETTNQNSYQSEIILLSSKRLSASNDLHSLIS